MFVSVEQFPPQNAGVDSKWPAGPVDWLNP